MNIRDQKLSLDIIFSPYFRLKIDARMPSTGILHQLRLKIDLRKFAKDFYFLIIYEKEKTCYNIKAVLIRARKKFINKTTLIEELWVEKLGKSFMSI